MEANVKKRIAIVPAVFLTLLVSSPAGGQSAPAPKDPRFQATVGTQKRINRYFHDVVVPKLKPCWDQRVRGQGTIEIQYRFTKSANGRWAFSALKGGDSNLPKDQQGPTLACMAKAVSATSFPAEKGDTGRSYLLVWEWPVPLPPDADQQMARMIGASGGEGGGCDGRGARARCVTCSGSPLTCVYVCVGSDTCEVGATTPGGFDSICTEGGQCASGGLFGLAGTMAIY
jgi:hypothetical protein